MIEFKGDGLYSFLFRGHGDGNYVGAGSEQCTGLSGDDEDYFDTPTEGMGGGEDAFVDRLQNCFDGESNIIALWEVP